MSEDKKKRRAAVDRALSTFFTTTCFRDTKRGIRDTFNIVTCALSDYDPEYVYRLSGSISEFHIDPVMPCYGDIDIMKTATRMLAIPEGLMSTYSDRLQDAVEVYDMCDSDHKGYVMLKRSACFKREKKTYQRRLSTTSVGNLLQNAALHDKNQVFSQVLKMIAGSGEKFKVSGPASVLLLTLNDLLKRNFGMSKEGNTIDDVPCMMCPVWPPQAAGWATRYREHGWPDQVTIGLVLSNGCDVVGATHRRSREDEFMRTFQWRLSFSRAETLLLNTWTPVQQIVYHMLRFLGNTYLLTHACNYDDHDNKLLNNYHIKTLMLWSCELQPGRWWKPDRLLGICSQLLKTLVSWLKSDRCRNFFIPECNLFDFRLDEIRAVLLFSHLESFSVDQLGRWFVENYVSSMLINVGRYMNGEPGNAIIDYNARINLELGKGVGRYFGHRFPLGCSLRPVSDKSIVWFVNKALHFLPTSSFFGEDVCNHCISYSEAIRLFVNYVRVSGKVYLSCASIVNQVDRRFDDFYRGTIYLHLAHKLRVTEAGEERDRIIDALAAVVGFSDRSDVDNCAAFENAVRISREVSSSDTVEFHLCKEYLSRRHRNNNACCRCSADIHLALLYFNTGLFRSCVDVCTRAIGQQFDGSPCNCPTHYVDARCFQIQKLGIICNTIGLLEIYRYLKGRLFKRILCESHLCNTDLFFHCLRTTSLCVSISVAAVEFSNAQREYRECVLQLNKNTLVGDLLLYRQCIETCQLVTVILASSQSSGSLSASIETDSSTSLPTLLIKHASSMLATTLESIRVEMSSTFPWIIICPSVVRSVALYKFGSYVRCSQLCKETLSGANPFILWRVMQLMTDPPYTELLDDDFSSLVGLVMIVNPEIRYNIRETYGQTSVSQHIVARYLFVQCMLKLGGSVADVRLQLQQLKLTLTENCAGHETIGRLLVCYIYRKTAKYVSRWRHQLNKFKPKTV